MADFRAISDVDGKLEIVPGETPAVYGWGWGLCHARERDARRNAWSEMEGEEMNLTRRSSRRTPPAAGSQMWARRS